MLLNDDQLVAFNGTFQIGLPPNATCAHSKETDGCYDAEGGLGFGGFPASVVGFDNSTAGGLALVRLFLPLSFFLHESLRMILFDVCP